LKVIADLLQNQHSAHSFGFTTQHACVVKTHFGRKLNIRSFMQLIHEYYHPAHLFTQWLVTSRWQQLQSTLLCLQKTSSILQPLYADLQRAWVQLRTSKGLLHLLLKDCLWAQLRLRNVMSSVQAARSYTLNDAWMLLGETAGGRRSDQVALHVVQSFID